MAREEKPFGLRQVEETAPEPQAPVIRLKAEQQTTPRVRAVSPETEAAGPEIARLEMPSRDDFETRTHQPGIEALIENGPGDPDTLEGNWGRTTYRRHVPWGWFAVIGVLLAGAAVWSLTQVKESAPKAEILRVAVETKIEDDLQEEREAAALVDRLENAIRRFFQTDRVETLATQVRQPERVRLLLETAYPDGKIPLNRLVRIIQLLPISPDNRPNLWIGALEFADQTQRDVILEVGPDGEPKIDWETLVCHQPMKWDDFATTRPVDRPLDFRVYVQEDNFYSHEFSDQAGWICYRLTTRESEETLFGYVRKDSETARKIREVLDQNEGRTTSMILRLQIPAGTTSRRGVVISELRSPRWLYLDPPAN